MKIKRHVLIIGCIALSSSVLAGLSTFDTKDTGADNYYRSSVTGSCDWSDGGASFNMNDYGYSWNGFTYSSVTNPMVGGYGNQYAVSGSGLDVSGTGAYAVGYVDSYNAVNPTITFASDQTVNSLYVNNTAYAALSMQDGDSFAMPFESGDWFKLTITGFNNSGESVGDFNYNLADFTSENSDDHYVLTEWEKLDLTSLGDEVRSLEFSLTSSDVGDWGMNTPSYFAIDNVQSIPEPATGLFLLIGFGFLIRLRHTVSYRK